jgi:hypothetical protein
VRIAVGTMRRPCSMHPRSMDRPRSDTTLDDQVVKTELLLCR